MPIEHVIDHTRRLVLARGIGNFTDADMQGYQSEVWSQPEVAGYDEVMDMTEVKHIELASTGRLRQLADLAAKMDVPLTRSKFAIVAPDDTSYGLAKMFAAYRSMDVRSTKEVGVFRTKAEAFAFLGVDDAQR